MTMLPETARTRNGVARMKPFAMKTIMKKGTTAPIVANVISRSEPARSTNLTHR